MLALSIPQPYAELIWPKGDGESDDLRAPLRQDHRGVTPIVIDRVHVYCRRLPGYGEMRTSTELMNHWKLVWLCSSMSLE